MVGRRYPEPVCGALISNSGGKVLLVRSHKWNGKYVIPGGHIELGEKIEEALRREVREETGLEISDIEFICVQESINSSAFWERRHFIMFDFACRANSAKVVLNGEGEEFAWVTPEEALKMPVEPYTRSTIEKCIKMKSAGTRGRPQRQPGTCRSAGA